MARKSRVVETQKHYIDIYCEGKKTECFYFESFKKRINKNFVRIHIEGDGRSTQSLVKYAIRKRDEKASIRRKQTVDIWVVFDKDDNNDFDAAIQLAKEEEMKVAWSNEAFEIWYILHFNPRVSGMKRQGHADEITKHISKYRPNFEYEKNIESMYDILDECAGAQADAIKRAKKLHTEEFAGETPSKSNPCTTVHLLVEALNDLKAAPPAS